MAGGPQGKEGKERRGGEREGRSAKLKVSKARSYLTNVLAGKETNERKKKRKEKRKWNLNFSKEIRKSPYY